MMKKLTTAITFVAMTSFTIGTAYVQAGPKYIQGELVNVDSYATEKMVPKAFYSSKFILRQGEKVVKNGTNKVTKAPTANYSGKFILRKGRRHAVVQNG